MATQATVGIDPQMLAHVVSGVINALQDSQGHLAKSSNYFYYLGIFLYCNSASHQSIIMRLIITGKSHHHVILLISHKSLNDYYLKPPQAVVT